MKNKGTLAETLERFNRKERNLLIRDILGCPGKTLHLDPDFCERLAPIVKIDKSSLESAWWATDYHFDWLAGALLTFMKGEGAPSRRRNLPNLVNGKPEDVDLVIVAHTPTATTPDHLVLIEAKAYGHFTTKQYNSKVDRLRKLHAFYSELGKESPRRITFHYVLYSPTYPSKLVAQLLPWQSKPEHLHLKFTIPKPPGPSVLAVTRRNDDKGGSWECVDFGKRGSRR